MNLKSRTALSSEINFDGLVGPTHNFAGLAFGNMASQKSAHQISHPKAAALQGLEKMQLLMQLGLTQGVLPPHERPNMPLLRTLGFEGSDSQILSQVKKVSPRLFYAAYSSSSMWTANAATVSPSRDSEDGLCHFTPANLICHFHRSQETNLTHRVFEKIFHDQTKFRVHAPLPAHVMFGDEGAANHNRLCLNYGEKGIEVFVYGRSDFDKHRLQGGYLHAVEPRLYPARQTLEASQAVARRHRLDQNACVFVKQNPEVIDRGVFHNDVISVMNENVFLAHELAFENNNELFQALQQKVSFPIYFLKVKEEDLSVKTAVETYLFNSQLITLPSGHMALISPIECQENPDAFKVIQKIIANDNPISEVRFVDCRESMKNGGGPACLRLRVVLTEEEKKALAPNILLDDHQYQRLTQCVKRFYRESIQDEDLLDPQFIEESKQALDEISQILDLGSLYSFQK